MTHFAQALSSALLQFLWQGLIVAVFLWVGLRISRRGSAHARYLMGCAALAALAILPVITTLVVYRRPLVTGAAGAFVAQQTFALHSGARAPNGDWLATLQQFVLPIWAVGVLFFSMRLVWACRQISALKKCGEPAAEALWNAADRLRSHLGVTRPVRILVTLLADGPSVIGWLRPVILLPAASLLHLTPEQLESVLAHELAHIRRHDYLVNLLQTLVEAVLFYHPAVWWVSARVRHERELCCDDSAVRACGDALCYARALAALEKLRVTAPALAMSGTGGSLFYRIQRLAGVHPAPRAAAKLPGLLALALGAVCLFANLHWAHAQEVSSPLTRLVSFFAAPDRPGVSIDTGDAALLHRAAVEYPEAARLGGIQGTVVVEATLASNGTVDDARVLRGPAALRRAALQSVLQWHFVKDFAGSTHQVSILFDASKAEEPARDVELAEPGAIGVAISAPEPDDFGANVARFENIRIEHEPEIVITMAGSVLKSIQVDGIPEAARRELLSRLPVHVGVSLTDALIESVKSAVREFDEHLEVNLGLDGEKQAGLHITAPNSPGIFELRSIHKD